MGRILSTAFLSISRLVLISLLSTSARCDEPEIWGKVIMKQPFDTGPFRQIRVPAWVQETTGCGYTLSGMDSEGAGRGGRAWRDDQRDGLRRPVLSLLRQQAPQEAQPACAAGPARARHRRVPEAGRPHPGRLSALPPGRGL